MVQAVSYAEEHGATTAMMKSRNVLRGLTIKLSGGEYRRPARTQYYAALP